MPPRNFTDAEEEQIARIYLAGHSARAIARAYGLSHHISIISSLKRQNVKQRSPAERNRLYQIDAHIFDVIDTEEKAYWWGFLYADGAVYKRSLSISLKASDRNHLVKLRSFLNSKHPIKNSLVSCNGSEKKYKQALFYATDEHLANRLKKLGIIPRRGEFNQVLIHLPKELERHWIRGFFDGDGTAKIGTDKRGASIGFCGSIIMMKWIRKVVSDNTETNPDLSIRKHKIANIYYLNFSGSIVARLVTEWIYQGATIWLSRKKKRIDNWPSPQDWYRVRDIKGRFVKSPK